MLAGGVFVECGIARRTMGHEMEALNSIESDKRLGNFLLRVFTGRVERSDIAIAESGPGRAALRSFKHAHLALKVDEAKTVAESASRFVRFMVAGQHPEPRAERAKDFATLVKSFAECGQVSRGNVEIGRLCEDAAESSQIAVNIAEDQHSHDFGFDAGLGTACCG